MPTFQIILSALLAVCVLAGISMMSKVQTAVRGNLLSALAMLVGVVATLFFAGVVSVWTIYVAVIIGTLIGTQGANDTDAADRSPVQRNGWRRIGTRRHAVRPRHRLLGRTAQ